MPTQFMFPGEGSSSAITGEKIKQVAKVIKETRLSPSGTFPIPDLLDKKRLEYGIVDNAFKMRAAFDKILVWQIAPEEDTGETYPGTTIFKPEWVKKRSQQEAPRAVIVDAGLGARDALMSNGIRVGDTINFTRFSPYRIIIDWVESIDIPIVILHAGDISASEELAQRIMSGEVSFDTVTNEDGSSSHVFVDENGKRWKPVEPWLPDDY